VSDLFGWFQNYLNLSKLTALTVPGMVIAFGLILVLGPIPCRDDVKNCPYCTSSLKPVSVTSSTPEAETLTAHFSMRGPNLTSAGDHASLVLNWNERDYTDLGGKPGSSGPTVVFTSTPTPDTSDITSYAWKVNGQSICSAADSSPPANQTRNTTRTTALNEATASSRKNSKTTEQTSVASTDSSSKDNAPGSDPSTPPKDAEIPKASAACGQTISHRFTQPGIYPITLTITRKDSQSASVSGLVAILPPASKEPKGLQNAGPSASFAFCPAPAPRPGEDQPLPQSNCTPPPPGSYKSFPDKYTLPYGQPVALQFFAQDPDPANEVYVWKKNGYPICYAASCVIDFNSPDGKANQTGTWTVSLEVSKRTDSKVKSTAEQIFERDPIPPVAAHPTSLAFLTDKHGKVIDSPQTIQLRVSSAVNTNSRLISISGPGRSLFSYSLTRVSTEPGKVSIYELNVGYSPDAWFSPRILIDPFRARRGAQVNATLSIVALDHSTDVEKQIALTIPLSAAPDPGSAVAAAAATKKQKLANNTVITSSDTFLKSAAGAEGGINRAAMAGDLVAILQTNLNNDTAVANFTKSCKGIPVYIVSGSRPPASAASSSGGSGSDSKQGSPQFAGETATSVQELLTISDECMLAMTELDQHLQTEIAHRQALATQASTEVGALTTSLTSAQSAGSQLVVNDLKPKVAAKSAEAANQQSAVKMLTQADTYITGLIATTSTNEKSVISQVNTGPTASTSNAIADVFATIQQHFLMFLLFSLIIGQMFDPIQRGLLSFAGPRRNVFVALNKVYGINHGDGEIRYGDRRLPPWTAHGTYLPDLREPASVPEATLAKKDADEKGLRYSPADFLFRRNMNIYDQNYAIGAGYISQSEFNQIYNEFFRESQITTGLILPLLILSVCIGIRYICCSTYTAVGPSSWWALASILGTIYFAVAIGLAFLVLVAWMGSRRYWNVVKDALRVGVLTDRYAKDKEGRNLRKRWQELDRERRNLERDQARIAEEKARLESREKHLDVERQRRIREAEGATIAQHMKAAYLRALDEFPAGDRTSSDYAKWLFYEGGKLIEETQSLSAEPDPNKEQELKRDWTEQRRAWESYSQNLRNQQRDHEECDRKRRALLRDMRSYERQLPGSGNLSDWLVLVWQDPVVKFSVVLLFPALFVIYANLQILDLGIIPIIGMPSLFLAPLWIAGLDRLHKYYSELQARIAGNIIRLQQTTVQKMVDIVTSSSSKKDLMTNLNSAVAEQGNLLSFLETASGSATSQPESSLDRGQKSAEIAPLPFPAEEIGPDDSDLGASDPEGEGMP
jgi:hypothetical protein